VWHWQYLCEYHVELVKISKVFARGATMFDIVCNDDIRGAALAGGLQRAVQKLGQSLLSIIAMFVALKC